MKICKQCSVAYKKAKRDLSTRTWPPVYRCPNCGCVEDYRIEKEKV